MRHLFLFLLLAVGGCASAPRCDYFPERDHYMSDNKGPRQRWFVVEHGYCNDGTRRWKYGEEVLDIDNPWRRVR